MKDIINNRILIIDDNQDIHDDFNKALAKPPEIQDSEIQRLENALRGKENEHLEFPTYEIHSAYQGKEAVELVEKAIKSDHPFAMAFVDIRMPPGWDGIETIEHLWEIDKEIQTVICTAHSDYSWYDIFKRLGHSDRLLILKKPFDMIEIRVCALNLTKKWVLNKQAKLQLNELRKMVDAQTKELAVSLSLTEATLESTVDGIIAINHENKILGYNKRFARIWNIPEDLLKNGNISEINMHMSNQLGKPLDIAISPKTELKNIDDSDQELKLKNNTILEQKIRLLQNRDKIEGIEGIEGIESTEGIKGIVYNFRDITKRKQLEDELAKQATYDQLTGLPNRTLLADRIQHAIYTSKRNNSNVIVLFLDLDSFKLINDSFGHLVGDELLKIFANRLKNSLRETDVVAHYSIKEIIGDTVARLGGDEFVIVLTTDTNQKEKIIPIIQRMNSILMEPFYLAGRELVQTVSIGISIYPDDGIDPITLIKNADSAMYRAKENGKGSFEFYEKEMTIKTLAILELENELRKAMENNELYLNYQPIFDVQTKKIVSLEVLLRWNHPKLGSIPPTNFIPIAEEMGLMHTLGYWIMKKACEQNKKWQDQGFLCVPVAVNISGAQFKDNEMNIIDTVKQVLEETGLESKYLQLELTENVILSDSSVMSYQLQQLKRLGVIIDIDDFGSGYSSLSYINQFPVDNIKIDQTFIRTISERPESRSIVQAIMLIAKSLKMNVIAEGVETDDQLNILKGMSMDKVQGYFLSFPLSVEDTEKILKNNTPDSPS